MKSYRYNGEYWYLDSRPLWLRLFQWIIWIGGWCKYKGGIDIIGTWTTSYPWYKRYYVKSPFPISLFNHLFTFYGWGAQLKLESGYLVWCWNPKEHRSIYISKDGTPVNAHHWIFGEPTAVRWAAEKRELQNQDHIKRLRRDSNIRERTI